MMAICASQKWLHLSWHEIYSQIGRRSKLPNRPRRGRHRHRRCRQTWTTLFYTVVFNTTRHGTAEHGRTITVNLEHRILNGAHHKHSTRNTYTFIHSSHFPAIKVVRVVISSIKRMLYKIKTHAVTLGCNNSYTMYVTIHNPCSGRSFVGSCRLLFTIYIEYEYGVIVFVFHRSH